MALGWSISIMILSIAVSFTRLPVGAGAIWILHAVICIMGGMAANKGENYEVPVVGKFIADTLKL